MSPSPLGVDRMDEGRSSAAKSSASSTRSDAAPDTPAEPNWDQVGWSLCLALNRRQLEQDGFTFSPAALPVTQHPSAAAEPPA